MIKRFLTRLVTILFWANNPLLARPVSHSIAQQLLKLDRR